MTQTTDKLAKIVKGLGKSPTNTMLQFVNCDDPDSPTVTQRSMTNKEEEFLRNFNPIFGLHVYTDVKGGIFQTSELITRDQLNYLIKLR